MRTPRHQKSVEFEAAIDDEGRIELPKEVLREFGGKRVGRVSVRLTGGKVSAALKKRGVREEEIERIAALQRESRDQVLKFLLSEGAFTGRKIGRAGKR